MFCQIAIRNHRKGGTLADRYIMKWCTRVQSHWDGIRDKYEIWYPSTLTCSQKCGFWGFLGLDVFFPCKALLQFRFDFLLLPTSNIIILQKLGNSWHMVFPLSPPVYKLLLAPQVVVNQDMRALAAKRLESKQRLLYSEYSVCFVFTLSAVIQWALRSAFQSEIKHSANVTFQMNWFQIPLLPSPNTSPPKWNIGHPIIFCLISP